MNIFALHLKQLQNIRWRMIRYVDREVITFLFILLSVVNF